MNIFSINCLLEISTLDFISKAHNCGKGFKVYNVFIITLENII